MSTALALWAVPAVAGPPPDPAESAACLQSRGGGPAIRSTLIPAGYLSTSGSQIVDQDGQPVRIAAVGRIDALPRPDDAMREIVDAGFNALRLSWVNARRESDIGKFDPIVTAAGKFGVKVILANHTNEPGHGPQDNWGAQQKNGLWYDVGGASNDTDGGGNRGTTSDARFLQDWVLVARHYAGNDTVIGFDLRNEPLSIRGGSTWGDGNSNTDIRLMYQRVGDAIHAVNPGVLIIAEGPQNYRSNAAATGPAPWGDLSLAGRKPVALHQPNKIVYSVHDYPAYVSNVRPDSGPGKVAAMNHAWGYLVANRIAPVWIGEMGANFDGSYGGEIVADSRAWAQTLTDYVNGKLGTQGGPTFAGAEQGVSTNWWLWGYRPNEQLIGTLDQNGKLRAVQQQAYSQFRQRRPCDKPPAP